LDPYLVWSTPESFSYVLRLLAAGQKDLSVAGRRGAPRDRLKPIMPAHEVVKTVSGKVIAASSFEAGEGDPEHAVDGDTETFWHSRWSKDEAKPPHFLVIDYAHPLKITGLHYVARTDMDNGHVKDYELYASLDGKDWAKPVARGQFEDDPEETIHLAAPVRARYLKFVILSEQQGRAIASVAELSVEVAAH
jgi:beta-galactosidase